MHAGALLSRRLANSSANSILSPPVLLRHPVRALIFRPPSSAPGSLPLSYPPSRPYSTFPSSSQKEPRKASSFWAITFTLIAICGGSWLHDKYRRPASAPLPQSSDLQDTQSDQDRFLGVLDLLQTMPNTEAAPGTVDNLTPEQLAKLQEFWVLLSKVCGIKVDGLEETPAEQAPPSPTQEKKKQPKRRFTLWGSSKDDDDDSASVSSANGITGGLSNLSVSGDDKFGQTKEFQQALSEMKPEEIRVTLWNMVKQDNPDALLLRFLRARKWDVKNALIMLVSTIRWRLLEVKVDDDIMKNAEPLALKQSKSSDPTEKKKGEDFLKQMRMGKGFLHGVDKQGRPICIVRVRLHKPSDQSTEALDRFTVYTIESARMMLVPPVETACVIFDMTNFSLSNMDYHPVKFMIKCFEANYPECLGVVLIHKAPWIFSSIWNIIKGWLDPVVAAKINFTKNVEELEQFIPRDRIYKELEGDEDFEYKYVEVQPDENKHQEDTAKRDELVAERHQIARELEEATIEWISASRKKEDEATKSAVEKRQGLIERLRVQYWKMDPYVRATSLYDRTNVLQGGGKIEFYPKESRVKENGTSTEGEKEKENGTA